MPTEFLHHREQWLGRSYALEVLAAEIVKASLVICLIQIENFLELDCASMFLGLWLRRPLKRSRRKRTLIGYRDLESFTVSASVFLT